MDESAQCDECGSRMLPGRSGMASLCAECAHQLYDYPACQHEPDEQGRCQHCGWDGSVSPYLQQRDDLNPPEPGGREASVQPPATDDD